VASLSSSFREPLMKVPLTVGGLVSLSLVLWAGGPAHAELKFPERPGQRQFVADHASVLGGDQEAEIRQTCDALLTDTATPIVVVPLTRLTDYGAAETGLEDYARKLFDQWGVGHAQKDGRPWDTGILVLWVNEPGRTRVELGAGWGHSRDDRV